MPKTVFDSATLVSAFLSPGGLSDTLLQQAIGGVFLLFLSEEILAETERTLLAYERIRRRYPNSDDQVPAFGQLLRGAFPPITDLPELTGVSRDPKDDMVIACALKARAPYIVTRDDDLLSLGTYRRIKMITPEAFSEFLRQRARRRPRS
ncbi:MAG: putative toxin-antitoxin system toxin component, PIN family [Candidatus Entotheonellia bacterium]